MFRFQHHHTAWKMDLRYLYTLYLEPNNYAAPLMIMEKT